MGHRVVLARDLAMSRSIGSLLDTASTVVATPFGFFEIEGCCMGVIGKFVLCSFAFLVLLSLSHGRVRRDGVVLAERERQPR